MTPLIAEIAAAPKTTFQGIELPARFAELEEECRRLRQGAAVLDGGFRAWVRMRGEDRVAFLQGMVTNDVKALSPGQSTYAVILTQQGRVVSDLRIHVADDHLLLDFPAHGAAAARAALERYIVADDVEMEDDDAVLIAVEGPATASLVEALTAGVDPTRFGRGEIAGAEVRLAPASHAGETGVLLATEAGEAGRLWQALRTAGAQPVGFAALEVLRLEAGIPWLGVDMDEDTLIMEVGLDDAISFSKGCYLGQEVVERIAARGHVNRKRVGLRLEAEPVAARTPLSIGGKEVGWVTSSARSPRLGATIGMGYVRREHLAVGTRLEVAGGGTAEVAALPLVAAGR